MVMFQGFSTRFLLVVLFSSVSASLAQDCCLCDDCDMMMRSEVDLYDMDEDKFVSCEMFAEGLFHSFEAGGDQCTMAQDIFQSFCCYASHERRHLAWGATTVPFTSTSFSKPSSYSNWGVTQSPPAATNWGNAGSSSRSYSSGQSFSATPIQPSGGSCPRRSGICDFNCPSVPANRQAIHVSVDPTITGRNIPYFGALCGDVQNQFHCQNILSSDLRCSLMVARYRGECGCGGYQSNGASFWGTTQSSGTVGQWNAH